MCLKTETLCLLSASSEVVLVGSVVEVECIREQDWRDILALCSRYLSIDTGGKGDVSQIISLIISNWVELSVKLGGNYRVELMDCVLGTILIFRKQHLKKLEICCEVVTFILLGAAWRKKYGFSSLGISLNSYTYSNDSRYMRKTFYEFWRLFGENI